ncbi:MAG: hypothetical protein ACOZDY_20625 [Pseudomonadota bacterium]
MGIQLHLQEDPNAPVVIEFSGPVDRQSRRTALAGFDGIHHVWWRDAVVVLRDIDRLDVHDIEMLLYLQDRASRCSLRLVRCAPQVLETIQSVGLSRYFSVSVEDEPSPSGNVQGEYPGVAPGGAR